MVLCLRRQTKGLLRRTRRQASLALLHFIEEPWAYKCPACLCVCKYSEICGNICPGMSFEKAKAAEGFDAVCEAMASFWQTNVPQSMKDRTWIIHDFINHHNAMGHVVESICKTMAQRVSSSYSSQSSEGHSIACNIDWKLHVLLSKEVQLSSEEAKERLYTNVQHAFNQQLTDCIRQAREEADSSWKNGDSDRHWKQLVLDFMTQCSGWRVSLDPMSMVYMLECMENSRPHDSQSVDAIMQDAREESDSEDAMPEGSPYAKEEDIPLDAKNRKHGKHTQVPYVLFISCNVCLKALAGAEHRYKSGMGFSSENGWESKVIGTDSNTEREEFRLSLDSLKAGHAAKNARSKAMLEREKMKQSSRFLERSNTQVLGNPINRRGRHGAGRVFEPARAKGFEETSFLQRRGFPGKQGPREEAAYHQGMFLKPRAPGKNVSNTSVLTSKPRLCST